MSTAEHVLLGIGLNVATAPPDLPPGATSLSAELAKRGRSIESVSGAGFGVDPRDLLLRSVLDRLNHGYAGFIAAGGRPALDPWLKRAALLGELVDVVANDEPKRGRFVGLREDGALILRDEDGAQQAVVAGDLVRGPRYRPEPGSGRPDR